MKLVYKVAILIAPIFFCLNTSAQNEESTYNEYNCNGNEDCFVFEGKLDYQAIGNSMNFSEDQTNCNKKQSSSATLNIPVGVTVKKAFLHWSGSRQQVDNSVVLNGQNVYATKSFTQTTKVGEATNIIGWVLEEFFIHYYAAYADVTDLISTSGEYTVSGIEWDNSGLICDINGAMGAWSLVVVYEDSTIQNECKIHVCQDEFRAQSDNLHTSYVNFEHSLDCIDTDPNCSSEAEFSLIVFEGDSYKGETFYIGTNNNQLYTESGSGANGPFKGQTAPNLDIIQVDISNFIDEYDYSTQFQHGWSASNVTTEFGQSKEQAFDFVKILKYNMNSVSAKVGQDIAISLGESATLTATGGPNFIWSNGETGTSIQVSPSQSTTYSVTAFDPDYPECSETDEINVLVSIEDSTPCDHSNLDQDGDGFFAYEDCDDLNPYIPAVPGTPCNDQNANTINDVIQSDGCTCLGESNCDQVESCTSYNVGVHNSCSFSQNFSIMLVEPGSFFWPFPTVTHTSIENGVFTECSDGNATLTGHVNGYGDLNVTFYNKSCHCFAHPYNLDCNNVQELARFESFSGTLGSLNFSQRGADFSLGNGGAGGYESTTYGGSAWFNLSNGHYGDLNFNLYNPNTTSDPCCENPPSIILPNDKIIEEDESVNIVATLGGGATHVSQWSVVGSSDGTFTNLSLTQVTYTPGPNDIANGVATIKATTNSVTECGVAMDQINIFIPEPCFPNIGDYVWIDTNRDGIQDPGEEPVPGVEVLLIDPGPDGLFHTNDDVIVDSQITDENGEYLFTNVPPGDYCIEFILDNLADGFLFTEQDSGNDDELDSDANSAGKTEPFEVVEEQDDDLSFDAGIYKLVNVGNYVWFDDNQNGIQDPEELPISHIPVFLIAPGPDGLFHTNDDIIVETDVTGNDGLYLFEDVLPGTYCIKFEETALPTGYEFTTQDEGNNDTIDSDADETGKTETFTVVANQEDDLTWDAGIFKPVNIGDYVWFDNNQNGIQDPNEEPVEGVTVILYGPGPDGLFHTNDDIVEDIQTTDENGEYLFENVNPGAYCIQFLENTLPENYEFTQQDSGNDDTEDSDVDETGKTEPFTVESGQDDDLTWDAGIFTRQNVGDYVWFDENQNGIQDPGEDPVEGVTVQLIGPGPDGLFHTDDDELIDSQVTDENGEYLFENVIPGDYCIQFDQSTLPSDFQFTSENEGNDDSNDSDADENGKTDVFTVDPNQPDDLTWDAGIFKPVNVGDYVWFDEDKDGIQDPNEDPVEGVTVNLISAGADGIFHTADDIIIDSQVTDENGEYLFINVLPGEYCIEFETASLPNDFIFTDQNQGNDDDDDSDVDENGKTDSFVVIATQEDDLTWDAGIHIQPASLGDTVWEDEDKDGEQDPNEEGVEGITVELYICGEDEPIATTTTDENGNYLFEDLEPNIEYFVVFTDLPDGYVFTESNQGGDDELDSNADENGETECTLIEPGENDDTIDAGVYLVTNVGNYVWFDEDVDGIQDGNEDPVEGVEVLLISAGPDGLFHTDDDVVVDTQTTDENGFYLFEDVDEGDYCIQFVNSTLPDDFVYTLQDENNNDAVDSDTNQDGKTEPFFVEYGQDDDLTWDAGITICTTPEIIGQTPEDEVFNCEEGVPSAPELEFSDLLDSDLTISFEEEMTQDGCNVEIIRTWTVSNFCGNELIITQLLNSVDNSDPVLIGIPADETLECDETPNDALVSAQDNCDDDLTVSLSSETEETGCGFILTRTWTVQDDCGNEASESQVITFMDSTDPVMENQPEDFTIECDEEIPSFTPIWSDNCDDELETTSNSEMTSDGCTTQIINTWTATDECDNETTITQTISVVDTTEPILSGVPEDVSVECTDIPETPVVSATDNCDDSITVEFNEETDGDACNYTITRTWTATDECNNEAVETQVITVSDTTAPVLSSQPEDITVECDAIPDAEVLTATDNCEDGIQVLFTEESGNAQECDYEITRTWTATDECGNETSYTQTITVTDSTMPTLESTPEDLTLECDGEIPFTEPVFSDNCDQELEITFAETSSEVGCNQEILRVWIAKDNCNNTTNTSQTITLVDTTAPELNGVPEDQTFECSESIPDADVTAFDFCDDELDIDFSEVSTADGCTQILTRTWTVQDDCGNETTDSQIITLTDSTDPVMENEPEDLTLECDEDIPSFIPIWSDNCDDNLETTTDSQTTSVGCNSQIVNTWTATDNCDNETVITQLINIVDTTDPELIGVPEDTSVECSDIPDVPTVTALDNCDEDVTVEFNEETEGNSCNYTITRTWTATDNCDNEIIESQTIQVSDTTEPILSGVPEDVSVECTDIPETPVVSATDNCDDSITVEFNEETNGDACNYTITRTWTATDECDNETVETQVITVSDTTAPALSSQPEDITVECDAIPDAEVLTATDNCEDGIQVLFTEESGEGTCDYQIIRTWTAADGCGNETIATQIITVSDTTDPVIESEPADLTIECDEEIPFSEPVFSDNCDELLDISFSETSTNSGCNQEITRVWEATDNCNNTVIATQTITVVDTTAPVLNGVPDDLILGCAESIPDATVTASDNCDGELTVEFSQGLESDGCFMVITRTWRVEDDCENETLATQTISFVDTEAPFIDEAPEDISVLCDEIPDPVIINATDSCDDDLSFEFTEETIGEGCEYQLLRTWTATDCSGNISETSRTITVTDGESPVFAPYPVEIEVNCEDFFNYTLEVSDNCDDDVELIFEDLFFSGGCFGVRQRTWTATDNCGNETTALQFITQVDLEDPILLNVPEDITIECGEDIPVPVLGVSATDNCHDDVSVTFSEIQSNEFCPYTITRTWEAEDACGNVTTDSQIITVTVETPGRVAILSIPNPTSDQFRIEFSIPVDEEINACIYNAQGQEMIPVFKGLADKNRLYSYQINPNNWNAGIYIFQLIVKDKVHHHKIMITQN